MWPLQHPHRGQWEAWALAPCATCRVVRLGHGRFCEPTGLTNTPSFPNFYCCTPQLNDCQANATAQVPCERHMASVNQRDVTALNNPRRQNQNTKCQISACRTRSASAQLRPWTRCHARAPVVSAPFRAPCGTRARCLLAGTMRTRCVDSRSEVLGPSSSSPNSCMSSASLPYLASLPISFLSSSFTRGITKHPFHLTERDAVV